MSGNLIRKERVPWHPLPHMQEYLDELTGQLRSDDYIRKIRVALSYFATFVQKEGIKHPDELTRAHVIRFQSWVGDKEQQGEWQHSYAYQQMVYLRGWLNWMEDVEYIEDNPWRRIKLRAYSKQPNPVDEDDLALLFETHRKAAFSMPPFYWHRREAIITLLYGWGLRIHELVALDCRQMGLTNDFVTMRQKGANRKKNLPYTDPIKGVIGRWLRARSQYGDPSDDALIIDRAGTRIGTQQVYNIVTDLGKQAGIEINPHRLRDTFGTDAINADMPVERIAKIMGHTNTKQTLAYADINDRSLFEAHDTAMSNRLNGLLGT